MPDTIYIVWRDNGAHAPAVVCTTLSVEAADDFVRANCCAEAFFYITRHPVHGCR